MPIMVSMYNYHISGVDISDQRKPTRLTTEADINTI